VQQGGVKVYTSGLFTGKLTNKSHRPPISPKVPRKFIPHHTADQTT